MATIHNSKFLRADTRQNIQHSGYRMYVNMLDEGFVVNDVFLEANQCAYLDIASYNQYIILPVAGSVLINGAKNKEKLISPGEVYVYPEIAEGNLTIMNPFPDETVNFLCINNKANDVITTPRLLNININAKNCLISGNDLVSNIKLGVYDSRIDDNLLLRHNGSNVFTYIINGSFEVEGRLMEYRDGLLQWNTKEIKFESLSETAIILFIEYSPLK